MGMIVKAHIDDPSVIHKIDRLLKSKKYASTTSLVLQAIQNLIEEEDEGVQRKSVEKSHIHPFSFKVEIDRWRKEFRLKEYKDFINHFQEQAEAAIMDGGSRILPGDAGKLYGPSHIGLVWFWHNRILPVKWLLRTIILYTLKKERAWLNLEELKDYIEFERLPYVSGMRNGEKLADAILFRSSRLAHRDIFVGFPEIKKKFYENTEDSEWRDKKEQIKEQSANRRFFDQFLGKVVSRRSAQRLRKKDYKIAEYGRSESEMERVTSGACFEMDFLAMRYTANPLADVEPDVLGTKNVEVALTPSGAKFACMKNELLDVLEQSIWPNFKGEIPTTYLIDEDGHEVSEIEIFSREETEFIMEHFSKIERYWRENKIVRKLLQSSGRIPMKKYRKIFDDIAKAEIDKEHKSSTIGRLIELNLVYRTGKKGDEAYVVQPRSKVQKKRA